MKSLFALLLLVFPFVTQAFDYSEPKLITGTKHLYRGAQPIGHAADLADFGIDVVVIFKNDVKGEVVREKTELAQAGYSQSAVHHSPMAWKDINLKLSCQQTIEALQVLLRAEAQEKNAYVHCTAGQDRTGLVSGIARMILTGESTEQIFQQELCANQYSDGNPNKPYKVVKAIEQGLTPLFFALAKKVEANELTAETLSTQLCETLKIEPTDRSCRN
jgi:hypothetical protein